MRLLSVWMPGFVVAALATVTGGCGKPPADPPPAAAGLPPPAARLEVRLPAGSPKLARIRVEPAAVAEVPVDEVTSPGKVEANPNRLAHVVLPLPGRVAAVSVKIGDFVRQGQAVLEVESPDIDAAISSLQQAEAGLIQAGAAQAKAQADADRTRDLYEHNAVAQKDLLNAEAVLTQAKAGVEQARAAVQQARRRLEIYGVAPGQFGQRVAVRAPLSGKVLEMNTVPGEFRNDTSAPVMTIADLSSVWVTAEVPETSIRLIEGGERVSIDFAAYPGETFHGRVAQIADVVDPQTRTVKVRCELENRHGRLRPEMFGRVRHTERVETRVVIPAAAIVQEDGRNVVWREVEPGLYRPVAVELGGRAGGRTAVLGGLRGGDRVVTDGVMLLKGN